MEELNQQEQDQEGEAANGSGQEALRASDVGGNEPPASPRYLILQKELMKLRPELTDEKIAKLVSEKKSKVGAGYLTDQGALFLVASELGVNLKPNSVSEEDSARKFSELEPGLKDLVLLGRLVSYSPPRRFKNSESTGASFRIVLYDLSSTIALTVWNHPGAYNTLLSNFEPGDGLRLKGVYTKAFPAGAGTAFYLPETGEISKIEDGSKDFRQIEKIPLLSKRIVELHQLATVAEGTNIILKAKLASAIRTSLFKRRDTSEGQYVSFSLAPSDDSNLETRVILWENLNPSFERLCKGEVITLLNVKSRTSEFMGSKTLELHGDETTVCLEHWKETQNWLRLTFTSLKGELTNGNGSRGSSSSFSKKELTPFVARILSIGQGEEEVSSKIHHLLVLDSSKRLISVVLSRETSAQEAPSSLKVDDVVLCKPTSLDYIGLRATCSSMTKVKPERKDIPLSASLVSTIEKLEPNTIASLDCMVLSITPSRELQTKEGLVKRSEALLADPTGEIRLYAWRGLSKHLDSLTPGTRLWLRAVEVQSLEGKKFLVFKNSSRIELSSAPS